MKNPTTQDVANRLRPILEKAVRDRTGLSYFLTAEEEKVFSDADMAALAKETGYPAPDMHVVTRWTTLDSTRTSTTVLLEATAKNATQQNSATLNVKS